MTQKKAKPTSTKALALASSLPAATKGKKLMPWDDGYDEKTTTLFKKSTPKELPGENPYDEAVRDHGFSYAEAKQREESALVVEKIRQAKIATEQAQIALDKEKLVLQQQRGDLIETSEYIARQEIVISTFQELLRLVISECVISLSPNIRDEKQQEVTNKANNAMDAIGGGVLKKKSRDAVMQMMFDAFKGQL